MKLVDGLRDVAAIGIHLAVVPALLVAVAGQAIASRLRPEHGRTVDRRRERRKRSKAGRVPPNVIDITTLREARIFAERVEGKRRGGPKRPAA